MKFNLSLWIYVKYFPYIIFLIASFLFSSCAQRIKSKYDAKNIKKLSRVYIVNKDGKDVVYKSEDEWEENTSTNNPWGYSVLRSKNELFSGVAIKFYRKGLLKIPTGYAIFNYKDGYIDGAYKYCLMDGSVLAEGEAIPNKSLNWDQSHHSMWPISIGGMAIRELTDKSRKEFIVREKVYKSNGILTSHYVKDSLYFYITACKVPSIEVWEEHNYELKGKFKYILRTDKNGDTLYYWFSSDTLEMIIERGLYYPKHKYYDTKSEYNDDWKIEEWDNISGYVYRKNTSLEITTTLEGDTLEIANLSNGKYHGSLLKFTPNRDTIEKINFKDGILDGKWIRYDSKGDTLHFRNFANGRKNGKWIGSSSSELCSEFRRGCNNSFYFYEANYNENGQLDGLIKEYWKYGGEKKLQIACEMKNGFKNGFLIIYNDLPGLSGKVETKIEYVNGVMHGDYEYYSRGNGKLREKGRYENGKMNGKWIYYYMDSDEKNIASEGEYLNGELFGEWIYYNKDGTINRKENH
jgi:antitoxin component YwqK of YwqJK toxin-antitoxin module